MQGKFTNNKKSSLWRRFREGLALVLLLVSFCSFAQQNSKEFNNYLSEYGFELDSTDNIELFKETCFWEAVPYKYAGKTQKGIDCSTFAKYIQATIFNDTIMGSARDLCTQSTPISKDSLQTGDMIFFKIGRPYVSHVGIYLKDGKFVHATTRKGITVSSLDMKYYKKHFFGAGRFCFEE